MEIWIAGLLPTTVWSRTATANQIVDLTPLNALTELQAIVLSQNHIVDLSSLTNLKHPTSFYMYMNRVRDLSFLINLTELQSLFLGYNRIQDLGPLRGLEALYNLDLSFNSVADLAPLVANPGLGPGDYLSVRQNQLDESDCPDLQELILRGVQVQSDVLCQ